MGNISNSGLIIVTVLFLLVAALFFEDILRARRYRLFTDVWYRKYKRNFSSEEEEILSLLEDGKEYPFVVIEIEAKTRFGIETSELSEILERLTEQHKVICITLNTIKRLQIPSEPGAYIPYEVVYRIP